MPRRSDSSAAAAPVYDPTLSTKASAAYLGSSTRTLRRLNLTRTPIPSPRASSRPKFGYKLSTLNAYRDSLEDPKSRAPKVRSA